jgi:AraC-like DNA-binding protein
MNKACELILFSNYPIFQIAKLVGYQNPYIFSRTFKKAIGVSPLTLRKNSKKSRYPYYAGPAGCDK